MFVLRMVRLVSLLGLVIALFASASGASAAVEWCLVGSPPPMHTNDSVITGPSVGKGPGDPSQVPASAYETALVPHAQPQNGKGLPTNYNALANAAGGMTTAKSATAKK